MAVVIDGDVIPDVGGKPGTLRFLWGTVSFDGTNPTPVALANYVSSIIHGQVSLIADATPGDDPVLATVGAISAGDTTLNIEAYKHDGTDPTLIDSGNNSALASWFVIGIV